MKKNKNKSGQAESKQQSVGGRHDSRARTVCPPPDYEEAVYQGKPKVRTF